jgi:hypothetical protein
MKPKSSSMVKFGQVMLAAYLLAAGVFFLCHDKAHMMMFLLGSIIWIGMIFIHDRNAKNGD